MSEDTPSAATAPAPASNATDVPGQGAALVLVLLATLAMIVSLFVILNDQQWDEARRVMESCHAELIRLIDADRESWESNHTTRLKVAEGDIQTQRDLNAPQALIDDAESRRAALARQEYSAPPLDQIVPLLEGGAVAILLETNRHEFRVGNLRWFAMPDFTFRTYMPVDDKTGPRPDVNGNYWYIEVRIAARPEPEEGTDDADTSDEAAIEQPDEILPPEGWGRIYADGSSIGPFPPDTKIPDGHPPFVDGSVVGPGFPGGGMRMFPGAPGGPGSGPGQ